MTKFTPCANCHLQHPVSLVEQAVMNYDALPPRLKGWRCYRIEYGHECACPEDFIYLPPHVDADLIEDIINGKKS